MEVGQRVTQMGKGDWVGLMGEGEWQGLMEEGQRLMAEKQTLEGILRNLRRQHKVWYPSLPYLNP